MTRSMIIENLEVTGWRMRVRDEATGVVEQLDFTPGATWRLAFADAPGATPESPPPRTTPAPRPQRGKRPAKEPGAITLRVDNMGDSGIVTVSAAGSGVIAWSEAKKTLLGIKWSRGAKGTPMVILDDYPSLVRDIETAVPDAELDLSAYLKLGDGDEAEPPAEAKDPPPVERPQRPASRKRKPKGRRRAPPVQVPSEVPADDEITLSLDNLDRDDGTVLVIARGRDAPVWADFHQSLLGSRWEVADGAMPYVLVSDDVGLVDKIRQEHPTVRLDVIEYSPRTHEELAELERAMERKARPPAKDSAPVTPADDNIAPLHWAVIEDAGIQGAAAQAEGGQFKILRASGETYGLFFEYDQGGYQQLACGRMDALKGHAKKLSAQERKPTTIDQHLASLVCPDEAEPAANQAPSEAKEPAAAPRPATPKASGPKESKPAAPKPATPKASGPKESKPAAPKPEPEPAAAPAEEPATPAVDPALDAKLLKSLEDVLKNMGQEA